MTLDALKEGSIDKDDLADRKLDGQEHKGTGEEYLEQSSEESTEQAENEVEVLAREKGWRPKEEYQGDQNEWIDAKEFVERGPLYEAIHKSNREIKRLKEANLEIKKWYDRLETTTKERLLTELKGQLKVAAEEKDIEVALDLKDKITKVENEEYTRKSTATNEVFDTWVAENEWYERDEDLKLFADGIGHGLFTKNPDWKLEQIYEEVAKVIKRKFPDKFGNDARKKQNMVEGGNRSTTTKSSVSKKTYTFSSLPEDAKTVYRRLVKSEKNPHGILTSEEFFKDYIAVSGATL